MGASAGGMLNPGGEGLPGVGVPNRAADVVEKEKPEAAPERGAMDFANGEKIVGDQRYEEGFGRPLRGVEAPPGSVNGPAHNRRVENGDGGEDDQPFVSSRIGAMLPGEKNQRDEAQDVESGNGKERKDIGPPGVTDHFVDSCENRKNGHGAGESEAEEAEAAMNVHAVRGDQ
jgi:hypothetical protein